MLSLAVLRSCFADHRRSVIQGNTFLPAHSFPGEAPNYSLAHGMSNYLGGFCTDSASSIGGLKSFGQVDNTRVRGVLSEALSNTSHH